MRWILLDVVLALLSLALLTVVSLGVWRRSRALTRELGRAGALVFGAGAALSAPPTGSAGARLGGPHPDAQRTYT